MSKAWPVHGLDPSAPLEENARKILRVRTGEFYSYELVIRDIDAVEDLHNLRISAKRLRYTLELFRAVFGERGERNISRVKAIQEELGNVHDADVRIDLIEQELVALAKEQALALRQSFRESPPESHEALINAAMHPTGDDPRHGLVALLGRATAARVSHFHAFIALWDRYALEGMREELVTLSAADTGD